MRYSIVITVDAQRDIDDILDYIAMAESQQRALGVLQQLETVVASLALLPERGRQPRELTALGISDIRERFFKPYRILYRIADHQVRILLVADGRRDMQTLLLRRLLGSG